jgi:hypothetical protein
VGYGKGSSTQRRLEAALECPPEWPPFELVPPLNFMSCPMTKLLSPPGERVGDRRFDAIWRLVSADRDAALAIVGPEVRGWLADAPSGERWCSRNGWLSCTWSGKIDEHDAERVLARTAMFLSKVDSVTGAA